MNYDFEKIELNMHNSLFNSIKYADEDSPVFTSRQTVKDYSLTDIERDGSPELMVISSSVTNIMPLLRLIYKINRKGYCNHGKSGSGKMQFGR